MSTPLTPLSLAGIPAGGAVAPTPDLGAAAGRPSEAASHCEHCGQVCGAGARQAEGRHFCCLGCETVFTLLRENGLSDYYRLGNRPGARVADEGGANRWAYLDEPALASSLLDFTDGRIARVTWHLPAVHCVACVWLLENLFRLQPGVGRSQVNFARREVSISFDPGQVRLSALAALLARLGYPPELTLAELDRPRSRAPRMLFRQIAVAGFAFGNVMLFSLPLYLGLDSRSGSAFRAMFGALSLLLALPVVIYSAADYWRSAWASLRQRMLTLDVPIAAGLAALYLQSAWEIVSGRGEGYLDSLCGLVFFLLLGRAFQQKTHDRLGFDRDYRGFFPLSVVRRGPGGDESVAISQLAVGDRLIIRHGELIPADGRLVGGEGLVDYSFVTGEAVPVRRDTGEHLYAGGRQVGGAIEVETVKPVSQSYLTSLWNDEAFRKDRDTTLTSMTNRYSRRFTLLVIAISVGSALGWALLGGDPARGLKAFTSVLIVACPCALALAAPFTLGTAHRLLARRGIFLRNAQVLESMAAVDTLALDKTGTLTAVRHAGMTFVGAPLEAAEQAALAGLCRQSAHPHARRIAASLGTPSIHPVNSFREVLGRGMSGEVDGTRLTAGSAEWLAEQGIAVPTAELPPGSVVHVAVDGRHRGTAVLGNELRPAMEELLPQLSNDYTVALLSGDNPRERDRFSALLGGRAELHFELSPQDKLALVRRLQSEGRRVMMVGDGLNDAGALRQGDVGVAVVEGAGKFSPASDVILDAAVLGDLGRVLTLARRSTRVVRLGFAISGAYNLIGVAIAAAGILSPLICAVLMPLSSVTVVLCAVGATRLAARRSGLAPVAAHPLST